MNRYDYIIVGGGIVGLAVARAIQGRKACAKVALLEKEEKVARHQSGRNSGVIHSGIYYPPTSLKARLCRDGRRKLRDFCAEHQIAHENCGKVIVATRAEELERMEALYQRGLENGLKLRKLCSEEVSEIEPHVRSVAGIHVEETGIVDFVGVCRKLAELIQQHGGMTLMGTAVTGFHREGEVTIVETTKGVFSTRWLVNCAGLHSDRVASMDGAKPDAQIVPFRGEYYELMPERRHLVKNLIYPVPDPRFPFLGVHFTRMIDGGVHAGPNAVLSLKREGYSRTDFNTRDCIDTLAFPGFWRLVARHAAAGCKELYRSMHKGAFVRCLQQLIPEVRSEDLVPAPSGVRAQALLPDGRLVDDFLFLDRERAIHVCNAPSPAATSSLEIAEYVASRLPGLEV